MEEINKTLYYIRGVKDRGEEVLQILKNMGANNWMQLKGCDPDSYYFIDGDNVIDCCNEDDARFKLVKCYGTELFLPERSLGAKTWDDIEETEGYFLREGPIFISGPSEKMEDGCKKGKDIFYTRDQALSAEAAAMISQIRYQGKDIYGDVVPKQEMACIISGEDSDISFEMWENQGGLLRFESMAKAELFLENNRKIVETYLKTF